MYILSLDHVQRGCECSIRVVDSITVNVHFYPKIKNKKRGTTQDPFTLYLYCYYIETVETRNRQVQPSMDCSSFMKDRFLLPVDISLISFTLDWKKPPVLLGKTLSLINYHTLYSFNRSIKDFMKDALWWRVT